MPSLVEELSRELLEASTLIGEQVEKTEPLLAGEECVVVTGSGDSYAAALAVDASTPRATAFDPLELIVGGKAGYFAKRGCVMLALSVGGRTRSVVEAARVFRTNGGRVVAVTSSPSSPLAKTATDIVEMVYGGLAGGIGAVRHLVMLAAAASVLGLDYWRPRSRPPTGSCFWLRSEMHAGCLSGYSAALFTVLKLYEVYGSSVRAERLEQLLHAPIYSVDTVVLYTAPGNCAEPTARAYEVLRSVGFRVEKIEASSSEGVAAAMEHAYRTLWCLYEAASMDGVNEPRYRRHRGLGPLTELIYG
jgi:fructoselysine-6-P-deglycase FrlB-like protein